MDAENRSSLIRTISRDQAKRNSTTAASPDGFTVPGEEAQHHPSGDGLGARARVNLAMESAGPSPVDPHALITLIITAF